MTVPEIALENSTETGSDTGDSGPELTTEALIEEVSIDGMCGVY